MNKVKPLSGRGHTIEFFTKKHNGEYDVKWGDMTFQLSSEIINQIVNNFFKDVKEWYELGASATSPIKGGLGEFVTTLNKKFTPVHSSAIAAILVKEEILEYKGNKPILLRKLSKG